jgi:exopolysaccharide production protein ExoY
MPHYRSADRKTMCICKNMRLAVTIHNSADFPLTADFAAKRTLGGRRKRSFDIVFSIISIIALTPIMLLISLLILIFDGGPAIIRHERIGRGGASFSCLKFRTMIKNGEDILRAHLEENTIAQKEWEQTRKLTNDPRVTKIGKILRKTSLDELPQIFNILVGEMSFVGPRPIVYEEIKRYGSAFLDYRQTRPGLTGAWQISGRSDVTYDVRIELDRSYISNWSLWLDMKIILKTIPAVIRAKGVY